MKLEKEVNDAQFSGTVNTYYAGNYIYKKGNSHGQSDVALTFFNSEEGYIEPVFEQVTVNSSFGSYTTTRLTGFEYTYQYKDHLGNIRLSYQDMNGDGVISAETEIKEENHYYPFGLLHKGYNNNQIGRNHNYGYNGKEEQNELGLNWSDYGARNYDATLGRWMNLDPLAENYYFDSPYVYTTNNPILYIDPDGRYWVRTVGENGTITYTAGKGDSAWSLYEQHGKTDGFSAAQADEMVQGQLRPNYVRKSDGMEMSNVEIGDVLKIYSGEKASDDMVITNTNENEFDPNVELLYEVPNFGLLGDLTGVNKAIQDMDVGLDIYEAEGIEAYTYYQIGIAKMEITYERMAGSPSSAVRGRGRAGRKGSTTSKGKTTSSSSGGKKTNSNSSGAGTSIKPGHTKTGQTVSVSGQNMDVIAGPQGGKYYINRNGTRVSLNRDGTKRK